jgi:hypothetical protein
LLFKSALTIRSLLGGESLWSARFGSDTDERAKYYPTRNVKPFYRLCKMDSLGDLDFANGPIPSLSSFCCAHYGRSISKTILDAFAAAQTAHESQWDQTLELVRSVLDTINLFRWPLQQIILELFVSDTNFGPRVSNYDFFRRGLTFLGLYFFDSPKFDFLCSQIPQKPLEDLIEYLLNTTANEGLVLASLASDKLSSIRTRYLRSHHLTTSVLASSLLSRGPCHLLHLELQGTIVTDAFMQSLASSESAKILKTFVCVARNLTSGSNQAWIRFTALETLRLLECEHPFTADLADAISRLPMLETLEIKDGYWFPDYLPAISALLAPHSLPNLRSVDIYCCQDLPPRFGRQLYNLLVQRPTSHLLEVLKFGNDPTEEESARDLFIKMHTLCPNLKYPFDDAEDFISQEMLPFISNITSDVSSIFATHDAEEVSRFFPRLEDINFYADTIPKLPTRWDMFQSLVTLLVSSTDKFVEITNYPPTLREVQLSFQARRGACILAEGSLDRFMNTICVQLPRLRSLKLHIGGSNLTHAHAVQALNSLRFLEDLRLGNSDSDGPAATSHRIEVTHPHLLRIPRFSISGVQTVPVWLPAVTSVSESTFVRFGTFSPNICKVYLDQDTITEARYSMFTRLATYYRITSIEGYSGLQGATISGLSLLKTITSLVLRAVREPLADDIFAEILPQLPLLSRLHSKIKSGGRHRSCDWLHHPRLCNLWMLYDGGSELDGMHFIGDHLPLLTTLDVEVRNVAVRNVAVKDLPLLESASLCFCTDVTNLTIGNCTSLQEPRIELSVGALDLYQLPALTYLNLSAIWVDGITAIGPLDLPKLNRCRCYLDEEHEERWEQYFFPKLIFHDDEGFEVAFRPKDAFFK